MRHKRRFGFALKYHRDAVGLARIGLFVVILSSITIIKDAASGTYYEIGYLCLFYLMSIGWFFVIFFGVIWEYLEEFEIKNDKIVRYIRFKNFEKEIHDTAGFMNIPPDLICVITYVYTNRGAKGAALGARFKGVFRGNIYSLTMLKDTNLKTTLEKIHCYPLEYVLVWPLLRAEKITPYLNERMKDLFLGDFIYEFFCTQEAVDELLKDRKCLVIIPESLWGKVQINSDKARIYIDKGY